MLEYFASKYYANRDNEHFDMTDLNDPVTNLIILAIGVAAAYLAYEANAGEPMGMRILITVVAFLFSNIYIIYYFIRYVLLGDKVASGGKKPASKGKKRASKGKGRGRK